MKSIVVTVFICLALLVVYYFGKSYFLKPRLEQGTEAAAITGILPDGSAFSLENLRGKYVLLDFWGSWCVPCRESHPALIELYNRFHSIPFRDASGFEILSFGIERNSSSWEDAIRQDSLFWPYHLVSTDLFRSPVPKAYNVRQIPTKFLINPEGKIIAVDPSLDQTREILKRQLLVTNNR